MLKQSISKSSSRHSVVLARVSGAAPDGASDSLGGVVSSMASEVEWAEAQQSWLIVLADIASMQPLLNIFNKEWKKRSKLTLRWVKKSLAYVPPSVWAGSRETTYTSNGWTGEDRERVTSADRSDPKQAKGECSTSNRCGELAIDGMCTIRVVMWISYGDWVYWLCSAYQIPDYQKREWTQWNIEGMLSLFGWLGVFSNPCTKSRQLVKLFTNCVDQQTNGQPKEQNERHNEHFQDDLPEQEIRTGDFSTEVHTP